MGRDVWKAVTAYWRPHAQGHGAALIESWTVPAEQPPKLIQGMVSDAIGRSPRLYADATFQDLNVSCVGHVVLHACTPRKTILLLPYCIFQASVHDATNNETGTNASVAQ